MAKNFGDKLVGSIGSLLIGILVFIGSFAILYYSEVRTDYSAVADKAVEITEAGEDNGLAYVTGDLDSPEYLGDDLYLEPGDYIAFDRTVEMYSWVEEKHVEDEEEYYTYDTKWIEEVPDSDEFDSPRRHENPAKAEKSVRETVSEGRVGDYELDMKKVRLLGFEAFDLEDDVVDSYSYVEAVSDGDYEYIFDGYGTYDDPEIGDIRIRYSVLPTGDEVTVFGRADGSKLKQHSGEKEKGLYRMFSGTKDDALSVLKGEYKTSGWIGRVLGFIVMWIGLSMILSPLSVTLELIPFLGKLGKGALGIITFAVALILTAITSFVLSIMNGFFGIIVIIVVVIFVGLYINTRRQEGAKKPSHPTK
jgi:hypothetical protein